MFVSGFVFCQSSTFFSLCSFFCSLFSCVADSFDTFSQLVRNSNRPRDDGGGFLCSSWSGSVNAYGKRRASQSLQSASSSFTAVSSSSVSSSSESAPSLPWSLSSMSYPRPSGFSSLSSSSLSSSSSLAQSSSRLARGADSDSDGDSVLDLTRKVSPASVSSIAGSTGRHVSHSSSSSAGQSRRAARVAGSAAVAGAGAGAGAGTAVLPPPLVATGPAAADLDDAADASLIRDPPTAIRRIERVGAFRFGSQLFVIDSHGEIALEDFDQELHGHFTPVTGSLALGNNPAHWSLLHQLPEQHPALKSIVCLGVVGIDLDGGMCLKRATRHGVLCAYFDSQDLFARFRIVLVLDHHHSAKVIQDFGAFFSKRQLWARHATEVTEHALGLTARLLRLPCLHASNSRAPFSGRVAMATFSAYNTIRYHAVAWPAGLSDIDIDNALYSLLGRTAIIESSVNLIRQCVSADANDGDGGADANAAAAELDAEETESEHGSGSDDDDEPARTASMSIDELQALQNPTPAQVRSLKRLQAVQQIVSERQRNSIPDIVLAPAAFSRIIAALRASGSVFGSHHLYVGDDASDDSSGDDLEQEEANRSAQLFSDDGAVEADVEAVSASDFVAAAKAAPFPLQLFLRAFKLVFDAPPVTAATRVFSFDVDSVNATFPAPPVGAQFSPTDTAAAAAVVAGGLGQSIVDAAPLAMCLKNVTRVVLSKPNTCFATGVAANDLLARVATVFCAGQNAPAFLFLVFPRSAMGGADLPDCLCDIRCQDDLVSFVKACVLRAEALIRSADALHPLSAYASGSLYATPQLQDFVIGSGDYARLSLGLFLRALAIAMAEAFDHVFLMIDSYAVKFLPGFSTPSAFECCACLNFELSITAIVFCACVHLYLIFFVICCRNVDGCCV